ncbi:MAG: histidine phosphatase family protein [Actinomycetota bacterium]
MVDRIVVVRHGETEWSRVGRHTGRTDIPLTPVGEQEASLARLSLGGWTFRRVWASPLQRATATATLAGYDPEIDATLMEWDYGEIEGRTNDEITAEAPGWSKWIDEVPGGEHVSEVGDRADAFLARVAGEAIDGDALVFAHGHLLAVLIARWLGLPAGEGRRFPLTTGSISVLSSKRDDRVLHQLNHRCGDELDAAVAVD